MFVVIAQKTKSKLDLGPLRLSSNKTGLHPAPLIAPLKRLIQAHTEVCTTSFRAENLLATVQEYSQEFPFYYSKKKLRVFVPLCEKTNRKTKMKNDARP